MKNSDQIKDVTLLSVISNRVAIHVGSDEQMQPGFVDFQNFAQGFGFASRKAIFWAREFQNPPGEISPAV